VEIIREFELCRRVMHSTILRANLQRNATNLTCFSPGKRLRSNDLPKTLHELKN